MVIGYARVSTKDQNLDMQMQSLKTYGCEKIFPEVQSAVKERPELQKMLQILRKGDKVIVWKLDRLGRSLKHLIELVSYFKQLEVELISLQDNIDTSTISGRMLFNIIASLAEFERELTRERSKAGLEAARRRGARFGRPRGLNKESKLKALAAKQLYENGISISEILRQTELKRATMYRYLHAVGAKIKPDDEAKTADSIAKHQKKVEKRSKLGKRK